MRRLLVAVLALALSASPSAQQPGRLSGRVLDDRGQPVAGARVAAASTAGRAVGAALTAPDGTFVITGLPAGAYAVTAERPGYEMRAYGQTGRQLIGTPVAIDAERSPVIEFVLPRLGVIMGTILDEMGQPTVAVVAARLAVEQDGVRTFVAAGGATSDRHGRYRIEGLPPGDYYIAATNAGTFASREDLQVMTPELVSDAMRALSDPTAPLPVDRSRNGMVSAIEVYYPAATSPSHAVPVTVPAGGVRDRIDLQLVSVETTRVDGIVFDGDGQPAANVIVALVGIDDRAPRGLFGATGMDGRFSIGNVPHGSYLATAQTATANVEAQGRLVSGITIRMASRVDISGRIVFDGVGPPPENLNLGYRSIVVSLVPVGPSIVAGMPPPRITLRTGIDGGFAGRVPPGTYQASVRTPRIPGDWLPESVRVGEVDLMDQPILIQEHQPITDLVVTFTDRQAEITGVLRHPDGSPESGVVMVAVPADRRYWTSGSRRARAVTPAPDGRYSFVGLPPGDYRLAAVTTFDTTNGISPEVMESLAAIGAPVSLSRGGRVELDFTVGGGE